MIRPDMSRAIGFAILAMTAPAFGQSEADRNAAQASIETFEAAFVARDFPAVIELTPPPMWDAFASEVGMEVDDLLPIVEQQMGQLMAMVQFEEIQMDLDTASGGVSGEDRPYFIVPTTAVATVPGLDGRVRMTSETLVLEDDGIWYVVRIEDDQQRTILRAAYPDLGFLEFAETTMEQLD